MVAIIGPPDKINYTISQQVVSNPYVQQPNSSNIIKIIQFVAYRYVVTISSKYNIVQLAAETCEFWQDPLLSMSWDINLP